MECCRRLSAAPLAAELVSVNLSGDLNARTFWFLVTAGFLVTTTFVIDSR
ncbi:hypothetical protein RS85_01142 [Microbacterium sp. SA39]|nr:hypothetical protein RS85_01142 [Microbacterium sp. SA39]